MNHTSRISVLANYLMAAVFIYFAYLQLNDEYPVRWAGIYGIAALACVLYLFRRLHWFFPAAIGVVAILWALTKAVDLVGKDLSMDKVFGMMQMISPAVQECREMLGLLIVTFWMSLLTFLSRRSVQTQN
jgi:Transmembrane family 220, helix